MNKKERLNWQETAKEREGYSTTREFASLVRVEPQTIVRALCMTGSYLGVKPIKLPNHRLLWPTGELKKILK